MENENNPYDEAIICEEKRPKLKQMAEYLAVANYIEIRWHQKGSVLLTFNSNQFIFTLTVSLLRAAPNRKSPINILFSTDTYKND